MNSSKLARELKREARERERGKWRRKGVAQHVGNFFFSAVQYEGKLIQYPKKKPPKKSKLNSP